MDITQVKGSHNSTIFEKGKKRIRHWNLADLRELTPGAMVALFIGLQCGQTALLCGEYIDSCSLSLLYNYGFNFLSCKRPQL